MFGSCASNDAVVDSPGYQTLSDCLAPYTSLFDMTALKHGQSASITSQDRRKRIGLKKRPLDDTGEEELSKKKKKEESLDGDLDKKPAAKTIKEPTSDAPKPVMGFAMERWDPNDFFALLKKADDEMSSLVDLTDGAVKSARDIYSGQMTTIM